MDNVDFITGLLKSEKNGWTTDTAPLTVWHYNNALWKHDYPIMNSIQISHLLLLNIKNYSPKNKIFNEASVKGVIFVLSYRKFVGDIVYGIDYTKQGTFNKNTFTVLFCQHTYTIFFPHIIFIILLCFTSLQV